MTTPTKVSLADIYQSMQNSQSSAGPSTTDTNVLNILRYLDGQRVEQAKALNSLTADMATLQASDALQDMKIEANTKRHDEHDVHYGGKTEDAGATALLDAISKAIESFTETNHDDHDDHEIMGGQILN